jgi:hypothetical protein
MDFHTFTGASSMAHLSAAVEPKHVQELVILKKSKKKLTLYCFLFTFLPFARELQKWQK